MLGNPSRTTTVAELIPARRRGGFGKTFDSLSNPNFRQLLIGSFGSFMGMSMSIIARGYLAYDLTGSAVILGLVSLASGIPQLILSPFAGYIADRVPKRQILIITQFLLALMGVGNALLVEFHLIQVWHLV